MRTIIANKEKPEIITGQEDPKKETLYFDWKSINKKYSKDKFGQEVFIKESRDKIAEELISFVKKRGVVQDLLRRCHTQSVLNSVIFTDDDVWGEIHLVMTAVLDRWETVCRAQLNKKKVKHSTIDGDLRMHTYNDIMGYFRCALKNCFADLFTHHSAQKRSATEVTFSNMASKDSDTEEERLFEDTLANCDHKDVIFKAYRNDMIRFLRAYDRENKTRLARLFVALINPKNNGAVIHIQQKVGISNKNFNEQKDKIAKILKEEFGDLSQEIMSYFEAKRPVFSDLEAGNKASRKFKNRKEQEIQDQKARPYRMNIIYGQRMNPADSSKPIYYATVLIDRSKTKNIVAFSVDGWENIYKKEEKITGKPGQLELMKPKLEKMMSGHIQEATDLFTALKAGKKTKLGTKKKSSKAAG